MLTARNAYRQRVKYRTGSCCPAPGCTSRRSRVAFAVIRPDLHHQRAGVGARQHDARGVYVRGVVYPVDRVRDR